MPNIGDFLRPNSMMGSLLGKDLKPNEKASVLGLEHKDGTEIDAELYQKLPDGRIQLVQKDHLDPRTLTKK